MTSQRPPKKSETIEVRLPYGTKTAFIARCRDEGRTVSDAVRGFMEAEIGARPARASRRTRLLHALAAAVAGLALGAVAAPSLAQAPGGSRAAFDRLDTDHDGAVSFDEFRR
ncbi:hypothetical protein GGQ87_002555 [Brevundimonas alba]|uniref:EF-hand domain-containing protein n=1 Tax=Brevundimonas alba TaxID=74314 RepID=A0A7X6BPY0_9CAUL|nr:EF-hand domain-containing protein [Brevundimonas alba]NJC42260.1 hypothetical protein [Brevundimonas alba]